MHCNKMESVIIDGNDSYNLLEKIHNQWVTFRNTCVYQYGMFYFINEC